jgi:lysophospholipase L1-like esterase
MEDAGAQVWRVIKHMETSGIKRLDRVILLFGGNDICAPSFEDMTSPVDFKSAAFRAFRLLSEHVAKSDHYADGKPLEVFVMQPLPMAQLLTSTSILDKKLRAYGEETTCRELQKKMFLPAKPLDYGDSPEAIQIKRISWFLPPNPAMICATLFGWNAGGGEKADDHLARISNRLRALREALADAVAKADGKVSREAIVDRIKFTLIDASGAIQLDGSDIAGDCFHLSAHGHESLARTILKEISGR